MSNPEATPPTPSAGSSTPRDRRMLVLIAGCFWALALGFALCPSGNPIPRADAAVIAAADIDPSPRFSPMGDDAITVVSVFERKCMDCHRSLVDNDQPRRDVNHYHNDVRLNHGLNSNCVNCHHQTDRNKLVLRTGETLGFSQSTTLCANCHGPTYRQWQRGIHGKTLGYWNSDKGESRRLICVECHDPHSPHYNPIRPLPAPNTLRMGYQNPEGEGHGSEDEEVSPLMRRARSHHATPAEDHPQPTSGE